MKVIFFVLLSNCLYGTAQYPDVLIYENDTVPIFANPLETYFEILGHREIPDFEGYLTSACWRGYIGVWELRNDSIFLKNITSCYKEKCEVYQEANLELMFENRCKNNEVFANWIDYDILSPKGELIEYVHQGYESIYEYEREFIFEDGILVSTKLYDNTKSHKSIYRENPDSLKWFLYKNINWDLIDEFNSEKKSMAVINFKSDGNGKPFSIVVRKGVNKICDEELERVVNLIPEWDRYYRRGKLLENSWNLPIALDKNKYQKY